MTTENLKAIAYDAFIYAYPMLEQMKTVNGMLQFMNLQFNGVAMNDKLPWDNVGMPIVAPNLTSMTGRILLDLSNGPVTVEIPEVKDRYIVYQCIDAFTHNFFYMGTRGHGGEAGRLVFYRSGQDVANADGTPVAVEGDHCIIVIRIVDAPASQRQYPVYDEAKAFSPAFKEQSISNVG